MTITSSACIAAFLPDFCPSRARARSSAFGLFELFLQRGIFAKFALCGNRIFTELRELSIDAIGGKNSEYPGELFVSRQLLLGRFESRLALLHQFGMQSVRFGGHGGVAAKLARLTELFEAVDAPNSSGGVPVRKGFVGIVHRRSDCCQLTVAEDFSCRGELFGQESRQFITLLGATLSIL